MNPHFGRRVTTGALRQPTYQARLRKNPRLNNRQKSQVKRLIGINQEIDYYDNFLAGTAVSIAGTIQGGFSTPIQGDSDGERVGDSIKCKSFTLNFNLTYGDATNFFRVILFRWNQNTATATPAVADVIQNTGAGYLSLINHDRLKQNMIHIMFDKTYSLVANGTACLSRKIRVSGKKFGRKKIEFNNAAITGTHTIYALFLSDSAAAPNPVINWYSRLMYTDA